MDDFFHAVSVFYEHLEAVKWEMVGLGLACHFLKIVVRSTAWRNILAAAFPDDCVRWHRVFGAYAAGVGVNAIAPARAGDAVKLLLARRAIPDSTYAALGSTLVAETLFDFVAASAFLVWALTLGVLPGLNVLPKLPDVDWIWAYHHPRLAAVVGAVLAILLIELAVWLRRRFDEFRQRVARGFAVFRPFRRYLLGVATWQALSWVLRITSIWFFLRAFGVPATVHNALLVQVVQSLSTLLPFSPGGAGTQQGLLVYVFRGKLSATSLLSFSVGMNVAQTALNVVLGFGAILVLLRTLRWRRFLAREQPQPADP